MRRNMHTDVVHYAEVLPCLFHFLTFSPCLHTLAFTLIQLHISYLL